MMAFLIELGHSASSIETSLLLTKQKLPILKSVTMTILRVTNKTVEEKTIIPERDCLMVQKPFLDPVSLPINGTDKLTAQDETRAAITQQAVRKKESIAYTYVLKIMC